MRNGLMRKDEAKPLVREAYRNWPDRPPGANSLDMLTFWCLLVNSGSYMLRFRCTGDQWQTVHGWLEQEQRLIDIEEAFSNRK